MPEKSQLFNAWIEAIINNNRAILKLSFGGIILIGSLLQFIRFPNQGCAGVFFGVVYILSTLAFVISLFTSLYKLIINVDYILEFATNSNNKSLKDRIKLCSQIMVYSFVIGMILTIVLFLWLLALKWRL